MVRNVDWPIESNGDGAQRRLTKESNGAGAQRRLANREQRRWCATSIAKKRATALVRYVDWPIESNGASALRRLTNREQRR